MLRVPIRSTADASIRTRAFFGAVPSYVLRLKYSDSITRVREKISKGVSLTAAGQNSKRQQVGGITYYRYQSVLQYCVHEVNLRLLVPRTCSSNYRPLARTCSYILVLQQKERTHVAIQNVRMLHTLIQDTTLVSTISTN